MKKYWLALLCACAALTCAAQGTSVIPHHETCLSDFCLEDRDFLAALIDEDQILAELENDDYVPIVNKEHTMRLTLEHLPGDELYTMRIFTLEYIADSNVDGIIEYGGTWETNNHTALGDSEERILELQGPPQEVRHEGPYTIRYYEELHMPEDLDYFILYWFLDGKLAKLECGFPYP